MSVHKSVRVALYIIALWGFLSFYFLPDFSSHTVTLLILLLFPSWFIVRTSEPFPGYKIAWVVVTFIFLFISCLDLFLNARQPYLTLAYQLSFLQLSKLYNVKRPRDYFHILFLGFTMMVVTAIKSEHAIFPLMLLPFSVAAVYAFALLTTERMRMMVEEEAEASRRQGKKRFSLSDQTSDSLLLATRRRASGLRVLYPMLSLVSLGVLALTVMFFLFFPRNTQLLNYDTTAIRDKNVENEMFLTGYANIIDLGSLAKILRDPTTVMRVKTSMPIRERELYLRGMTLDLFDGKRWYQKALVQTTEKVGEQNAEGIVVVDQKGFGDKTHVIRQDIQMIDFDSKTLFYVPQLVALANVERNIYRDANHYFFIAQTQTKAPSPQYTVYSYVPEKTIFDVGYFIPENAGGEESFDASPYLVIPQRSQQRDELEKLAQTVTQDFVNPYEQAAAIEMYLRKNYDYTLDLSTIDPSQPVRDFLFHDKRGHCELFATSMVLLLRSIDIPARLVTGFHGGSLDKRTNTFEIRKMDAHAWVEAYVEGRGWYQFDPTPEPPMEVFSGRLYYKKLKDIYELLSVRWNSLVLDYNNSLRKKLLSGVVGTVGKFFDGVIHHRLLTHFWRKFSTNITQPPLIALAMFLLALNVFAMVVTIRLRRRGVSFPASLLRHRGKHFVAHVYERIIRAISGRHVPSRKGATPREFALSLALARQKNTAIVEELMAIYYALRFGKAAASGDLLRRIDSLINELR